MEKYIPCKNEPKHKRTTPTPNPGTSGFSCSALTFSIALLSSHCFLSLAPIRSKLRWVRGFPADWEVKNPPTMQEMQVQSLDQGDALGEEMATHSSILACKIPWTEEPGRPQSMGSHRDRNNWAHVNNPEGKDFVLFTILPPRPRIVPGM